MYYLELIEKFWDFNKTIQLTPTAVTLYLYLLKTGFENNRYDFRISDITVSNDLGFTRKTIKQAKEKLRDSGLIEYQTNNGLPCYYKLILYYSSTGLEDGEFRKEQTKTEEISKKSDHLKAELKSQTTIENPLKILSKDDNIEIKSLTLQSSKPIADHQNIPTLEEFIEYSKTLETYNQSLDLLIEEKYNSWKNNVWKNSSGRPLTNWKSSLKSILPYLKNTDENNRIPIPSIPNIKRPKLSSD
jgi:Mn-dependent DtxR family transcriptional regulator